MGGAVLWTVIIIQILLSVGLFWATWQIWLLRSAFVATVVSVESWNTACEQLALAPPVIAQTQMAGRAARQNLGAAQAQWQRVVGILALIRQFQSFLGNIRQQPARRTGYGKRYR
ncbi:MAG: hypothetical protein HC919_00100 [Oscillatoriales cyanobacterium SM2_2_1]|nr:hypothetical protein [Oscillatoriales cyanobacterium SM2_2_1]